MKQLTKEQHEAILEWLNTVILPEQRTYSIELFNEAFPPSCCDSCADGDTCESEPLKETSQLVKLKKLEEFFRRIK